MTSRIRESTRWLHVWLRLGLLNGGRNVRFLLIVNLAADAALLVGWSAPAAALALWFGPDALLAYHLFVPQAQGLVRMHRRFTTARREVW